MSTKKTFFKKTFRDIFGQLHTEQCKALKKNKIVKLQLNLDLSAPFRYKRKTKKRFLIFRNCFRDEIGSAKWKEVNGKPRKIDGLILKMKADLKERPDNI